MTPRAAVALLLLGWSTAAAPAAVRGQVPDSVARDPSEPPATGGWAGWAALPHDWSTVVAITVVLPVGSAQDPEGAGGTAWLLGRTSADAIEGRLGDAGVRVDAEVDRSRTVYRVLAVPAAWARAYRAVEAVLFDDPDPPPGLEEARASLLAVHAFEAGAPVREFEREVYRMLDGAGDPWNRDPRGGPETSAAVTPRDLAAYRRAHYDRARSVVAVTGAVEPEEAARLVTGDPTAGTPPAATPEPAAAADTSAADPPPGARPTVPAGVSPGVSLQHVPPPGRARVAVRTEPTAPPAPAWTRGDRIHLVRDVTSGWIAAAWPVAPGTSRTALEMLVHRIRSELVTEPPPPGLFSAEVTLEELSGGTVALVVRVAVLPESVEAWEGRIAGAMDRVSGEPLEPGFFRFHRRRFRNLRLAEDARPEEEGLRSALDLRRTGMPRDLAAEIWAMDAEVLHGAASSLGPPRILVFGPDLASGDGAPGQP